MFLAILMRYCIRRGRNFKITSDRMALNHNFLLVLLSWPDKSDILSSQKVCGILQQSCLITVRNPKPGCLPFRQNFQLEIPEKFSSNGKVSMASHRASFAISYLAALLTKKLNHYPKVKIIDLSLKKFLFLMFLPAKDKVLRKNPPSILALDWQMPFWTIRLEITKEKLWQPMNKFKGSPKQNCTNGTGISVPTRRFVPENFQLNHACICILKIGWARNFA